LPQLFEVELTILFYVQSVELGFHEFHPFLLADLPVFASTYQEQQLLIEPIRPFILKKRPITGFEA
jgi:hypothetical protein